MRIWLVVSIDLVINTKSALVALYFLLPSKFYLIKFYSLFDHFQNFLYCEYSFVLFIVNVAIIFSVIRNSSRSGDKCDYYFFKLFSLGTTFFVRVIIDYGFFIVVFGIVTPDYVYWLTVLKRLSVIIGIISL